MSELDMKRKLGVEDSDILVNDPVKDVDDVGEGSGNLPNTLSNELPCLCIKFTESVSNYVKHEILVQSSGLDSPDAQLNFDHAFNKVLELRKLEIENNEKNKK